MTMVVSFPGGKKVRAEFDGFVVETDQSPQNGGQGTAPEPFSYFLASLATCAGIFALGFCQTRGLPTDGLKLTQDMQFNKDTHRLEKVTIRIDPPKDFPERYLPALRQSAEKCTVKRTISNPPEFDIQVTGEVRADAQSSARG